MIFIFFFSFVSLISIFYEKSGWWGARGPVDLGFATTGAKRRPNPGSGLRIRFFHEKAGDGAHEVRWTSALRRPERSGDRTRDVSLGSVDAFASFHAKRARLLGPFCMKRAGDGNRTHVSSLEGWCSTIELHPHDFILLQQSQFYNTIFLLSIFLFHT